MQRLRRSGVLGGDGQRRPPHRRPRARPRRPFRDASCWPTRTASTRSRCGCWASHATPRKPPRTRWCAPIGRSRPTTPTGSASCASGLAGDHRAEPVPHAGRAASRSRRRRRSRSMRRRPATGTVARAGATASAGPAATVERRDAESRTLGGPPRRLCRRPIGPPSCSATSTACPIPRPLRPSADPRAPSRPRSTGASPCCARWSRRMPASTPEEMTA